MSTTKLIIGTRGSDLALWQANETIRLLGADTELKVIKTTGDKFLNIPLQGQLEKGFFTKEIEEQLLSGEIDVAVHSLKDLPTVNPPGLELGAYLTRAAVSDLLIVNPDWHAEDRLIPLKPGCIVGATSLRRQALLKLYSPDVSAKMLRGNVPSRVRKCAAAEYGAIILARAGVERLGLELSGLLVYELNPLVWLPAPGQGAVAVQARSADQATLARLAEINHAPTQAAIHLERKLLANFEGGCHTAFGAWAQAIEDQWKLSVGLEEATGWSACDLQGTLAELEPLGPQSGLGFAPRQLTAQEELCQLLRL